MMYTVIYLDYKNDLKSEVTDGPMDAAEAWEEMKREYGTVVAMVPGNHPVYNSGSMEQKDQETAYRA